MNEKKKLLVTRNEISALLGIGFDRAKTLLATLNIKPVADGKMPLYSWPAIEAALGGGQKVTIESSEKEMPKREKRIQYGVSFYLTENELAHFEKARGSQSKSQFIRMLILDHITATARQELDTSTNGVALNGKWRELNAADAEF